MFQSLLEAYIDQYKTSKAENSSEETKSKKLKMIGDFLQKFASYEYFDALTVLEKLEDEIILSNPDLNIYGFLESTLTEINAREKRIFEEKQVSEAYLNALNEELATHKRRFVRVDELTSCVVCKKRIHSKYFQVFPNGVIVDQNCFNELKDKEKCPLTGQNFKKTSTL